MHQQEIDFVAIDVGLRGLAQVAHDQRAQPAFAGVQRGDLQQLPQLVNLHLLIHDIQPGMHLLGEFRFRFFLQHALVLRNRNFHLQVLGQRHVNGENGAGFFPLRQLRAIWVSAEPRDSML